MANTNVNVDIQIGNGAAIKSMGDLKRQLKEANFEALALSEKFGVSSKEAIEAAKRVAQLKDAIGDAKTLTEGFNPDKKFTAFAGAIQGVVGGFSALQGAQALFGNQSEELEKTLIKVQGALALTQGLDAIKDAGQQFKVLKAVAIDAFNGIKSAIGSTGIGLLVIALGAIYTYWDDIKGAVSGVTEEQILLNEETNKNLAAEQEKLKVVNNQDNVLKLQGKSEKEILNIKIAQIDATIAATEAVIKQSEVTTKLQIEAAERNKNIVVGILNFLEAPVRFIYDTLFKGINAAIKLVNTIGGTKFEPVSTDFFDKANEFLSKKIFDPEEVKANADKTRKENQQALDDLRNQRAGFQLQIKEIDKKAADDKKKTDDEATKERIEAEKKALEELTKARQENYLQAIQDEQERAEERLRIEYENQKKLIEQSKASEQTKNAQLIELGKKYWKDLDDIEKDAAAKKKKKLEDEVEDDYQALLKSLDNQIDNDNASKKSTEETSKARVGFYKDVGNAFGELSDLIGKQTAVGKGLAVAQATINTFLGATEVLRSKSVLPEPLGTISKIVNVAAIVAAGIKSVKSILSVKVPASSGGGGGGSVPSTLSVAAPIAPQVSGTALQQAQINQLSSATTRAFVLESDVSGNQERIQRLNRAARIN